MTATAWTIIADIRDLFGTWSLFTLSTGIGVGVLSDLAVKHGSSAARNAGKWFIAEGLPLLMGLLSLFLYWLTAASAAFSGSPERHAWHEIHRYDIRLSFLIAFTFGFAFAISGMRASTDRAKIGAFFFVVAYFLAGSVLFCMNLVGATPLPGIEQR